MRFVSDKNRKERYGTRPVSLCFPCVSCERNKEIKKNEDPRVIAELRNQCAQTCEYLRYFDIYGINKFRQLNVGETDFLLEWMNEILMKKDLGQDIDAEELEQLRVWRDRLGIVLNLEEAKLAAAYSAIERADELGNDSYLEG